MKFRAYISIIIITGLFFVVGCTQTNQSIDSVDNTDIVEEDTQVNSDKKLSEQDAINSVEKYLSDNGYHMSSHIEVDSVDGDNYLIHAYDVINNEGETHTATSGWFEVNMYTGEIKDIMKR